MVASRRPAVTAGGASKTLLSQVEELRAQTANLQAERDSRAGAHERLLGLYTAEFKVAQKKRVELQWLRRLHFWTRLLPLSGARAAALETRQLELLSSYQHLLGINQLLNAEGRALYQAELTLRASQLKLHRQELELAGLDASPDEVQALIVRLLELEGREISFTENSLSVADFMLS